MNAFGESITDQSSAERFVEWCVREIGIGFHPDTPFSEYVTVGSGMKVFDIDEAVRLDAMLEQAFKFCDPYETGLLAQRMAIGQKDATTDDM